MELKATQPFRKEDYTTIYKSYMELKTTQPFRKEGYVEHKGSKSIENEKIYE